MEFSIFSFFNLGIKLKNKKISLLSLIDKNCIISTNALINRFVDLRKTEVKDFSYIGSGSKIINASIGKFCSISKNVNIGFSLHPVNYFSTSPIFFAEKNGTGSSWVKGKIFDDSSPKVIIGNDVWIGMNSSIMGGVKIGDGAIIGSHALVTKDVPPYSIVGGVPARIIKYRFEQEVIDDLLILKWWDLPVSILKECSNIIGNVVDKENLQILKTIKRNEIT